MPCKSPFIASLDKAQVEHLTAFMQFHTGSNVRIAERISLLIAWQERGLEEQVACTNSS